VQAADQKAHAQLVFSTFGARAWCKLQIKRLRPNSRFQRLGRGHGASCTSRGSGPTRVFNVWGEALVQASDQEAQAQLAFSACGAKAWSKLQIKRLRPNSRFQCFGRWLGARCKSRGSCTARVFNVWGEGLVQAADQEPQANFAFSTFGVRAWSKLQLNRLKPNSRFQRMGRGLGARYRSRGSSPSRVFNVWGEGLVQAADQEAQAQLAFSENGMRAWCKVQIKRLRPNSRLQGMG